MKLPGSVCLTNWSWQDLETWNVIGPTSLVFSLNFLKRIQPTQGTTTNVLENGERRHTQKSITKIALWENDYRSLTDLRCVAGLSLSLSGLPTCQTPHVRSVMKCYTSNFAMCLVETKLEGLLLQVHKSPENTFSQINVEVADTWGSVWHSEAVTRSVIFLTMTRCLCSSHLPSKQGINIICGIA